MYMYAIRYRDRELLVTISELERTLRHLFNEDVSPKEITIFVVR